MSNEIAKYEATPLATLPGTEVFKLGATLYESGYFSDVKSASQAIVKILRGQELGIGPIAAMENIYVVQGKTALSYSLIGAQIKKSGRYDYRVIEEKPDSCEIAFFQGSEELGRSKFTMADAKAAGLDKSPMWSKYQSTMLFARAMSQGARRFTPDVFGGAIYTPEELKDIKLPEIVSDGEPIRQEKRTAASQMAKAGSKRSEAAIQQLTERWGVLQSQGKSVDIEVPDIDLSLSNDELKKAHDAYLARIESAVVASFEDQELPMVPA